MSRQIFVVKERSEKAAEALAVCSKVFVYGTLKREYGNSRLFSGGGGDFLWESSTRKAFVMYDAGCPMIKPKEYALQDDVNPSKILPVKGEVWQVNTVDCMERLDTLEGEGYLYHRRLEETKDGTKVWTYQVFDSFFEDCMFATEVEGEWVWP